MNPHVSTETANPLNANPRDVENMPASENSNPSNQNPTPTNGTQKHSNPISASKNPIPPAEIFARFDAGTRGSFFSSVFSDMSKKLHCSAFPRKRFVAPKRLSNFSRKD